MTAPTRALAIHVCADVAQRGPDRWWPSTVASEDTVRRAARLCRRAGIADQRMLAGEQASLAGLLEALQEARSALAAAPATGPGDDGLLVLTFAGHTERGEGPVETAKWCLYDGGMELSQIAAELARFPAGIRQVIVLDTCYAAAIIELLAGPQRVLVLACCGEDQTTIDRRSCELMVRLEAFTGSTGARGSLDELRQYLEDDTPDCERPRVWTNAAAWWSAPAMAPFALYPIAGV